MMQPPTHAFPRRITIVGVTGSGKTTLAHQLASRLNYPYIELDALHWLPDWQERSTEDFRNRLAISLQSETWVVDGNYSKARDLIWTKAEMLIWLDYPLPLILWRLARRTLHRVRTQEILWNNNYERWRNIFRPDSLFLWAIQSQRNHRRTYPVLLLQPEYAHLQVVRLHSPRETQNWLVSQGIAV